MLFAKHLAAPLALIALAHASKRSDTCAQYEDGGDDSALLQVRSDSLALTDARNSTKPSNIAALCALWMANGKQGTLIGWGEGDPCYGDAPPGQGNAQGFGPWKGVACVPCPDDDRYYCVSQIWQHQKNLNGTIPENFKGLSELEWLFLSANNLTGPMPENNWHTFPKLKYFDISYNTINGVLPLDKISKIGALRTILANDNHFDSVRYEGGGFKSLSTLNFMYNRNMSGVLPPKFAEMPHLRNFQIHDTNLTGTAEGKWPMIRNLIITGTGGLCGPLPSACSRKGVFCDVIYPFADCA